MDKTNEKVVTFKLKNTNKRAYNKNTHFQEDTICFHISEEKQKKLVNSDAIRAWEKL